MNNEILHDVISECRVIKSEEELQVLRYVNRVSSEAHKEIMRRIRPGWMEYQAERQASVAAIRYNDTT